MSGYIDVNGNNLLLKSFCAYFDILGFSEKIKNEEYSYFDKYLEILKVELDFIKEQRKRKEFFNTFELKVFTDNFVFGYPWGGSIW